MHRMRAKNKGTKTINISKCLKQTAGAAELHPSANANRKSKSQYQQCK